MHDIEKLTRSSTTSTSLSYIRPSLPEVVIVAASQSYQFVLCQIVPKTAHTHV